MYNQHMSKLTRRSFVSIVSVATVIPLSPLVMQQQPPRCMRIPTSAPYRFFDFAEAQFTEAACERLIPENSKGPGAGGAGIAHYIDQHLISPWGAGTMPFRQAAWQQGTTPYIPAPFTPATFFRRALAAINLLLGERHDAFASLSPHSQDQFLRQLESGLIDLREVPADVFFDVLLRMTVEGFLSDPRYAPTRDRIGWRLRGFPGAHATISAQTQELPHSKDQHAIANAN